jgi:ribonucleoside-diphosphate reductase alpha chain
MAEVVRQLAGIGGGRPTGFGAERVLSLPDGVSQMLGHYLQDTVSGNPQELPNEDQLPMQIGDLCPDCGSAALINEEGCRKCYSCGFSEC